MFSDLVECIADHNTMFYSHDHLAGFWQISLDKQARAMTAFLTLTGHHEGLHLPMDLRYALLTFHRMSNSLLAGIIH